MVRVGADQTSAIHAVGKDSPPPPLPDSQAGQGERWPSRKANAEVAVEVDHALSILAGVDHKSD